MLVYVSQESPWNTLHTQQQEQSLKVVRMFHFGSRTFTEERSYLHPYSLGDGLLHVPRDQLSRPVVLGYHTSWKPGYAKISKYLRSILCRPKIYNRIANTPHRDLTFKRYGLRKVARISDSWKSGTQGEPMSPRAGWQDMDSSSDLN